MSNYRLPCSCGQSVRVSTSQAGQTVHCTCGAPLEVPTLRGLRSLPPDDPDNGTNRATAWENRQRLLFSLTLVSLGSLVLGGYLWMRLPAPPRASTPAEIKTAFAHGAPEEVFAVYEDLKHGLHNPAQPTAVEQRQLMVLAVWIALGIGLCGLIAVLVFTLRARKNGRSGSLGTAEASGSIARTATN